MAYVNDEFQQDEDQSGGPSTGGGAPLSGNSNSLSQGAGGASKSPQQKTPTGFADLSEYLRVNQGQNFGSQLAGKVGDEINQGSQTLNNAEDQFKQRADAATVKDTNNLTGQLSTNPQGINADDFSKIRDAQYSGPSSFADTQDLYNQVQGSAGSAVQKANASKSEGGRFSLLNDYFNRPSYSQGQKSLDNLLVQNDPNSKQAFAQIQQNAQNLQGQVNQAGTDLGNYAAGAKGTTDATRTNARQALGIDDAGNATGSGALGDVNNAISGQYNTALSQQQQQLQDFQNAFSGNSLSGLNSSEQAEFNNPVNFGGGGQIYGTAPYNAPIFNANPGNIGALAPGQIAPQNYFYGVDPNQYATTPTLNAGALATTDQAQRLAALSKLAGTTDQYDPTLAGTQDPNKLVNFNSQGLFDAVRSGQGQFSTQQHAIINNQALNDTQKLSQYNQLLKTWGLPTVSALPGAGGGGSLNTGGISDSGNRIG